MTETMQAMQISDADEQEFRRLALEANVALQPIEVKPYTGPREGSVAGHIYSGGGFLGPVGYGRQHKQAFARAVRARIPAPSARDYKRWAKLARAA